MLINMEERRNGMSALCSHFGKNAISERIEAIMKFKKTSILACAFALVLVVGATTAFATSSGAWQEFDLDEVSQRILNADGASWIKKVKDKSTCFLICSPLGRQLK